MAVLHHAAAGDDGHPVVFLHGFMGSSADWRKAMAALEGSHRCIAVDPPGHGAPPALPPGAPPTGGGAARGWWEGGAGVEGSERCIGVDLRGHGASTALRPGAYPNGGAARSLLG